MKLWQKGAHKQNDQSLAVERFTIGNDLILDMRLAEFDVMGSLAHAEMLQHVGIVSPEEFQLLKTGLNEILQEIKSGKFTIQEHVEDIHSQIEKTLTERVGEAGKKLHTGRSRNDQVLLDIKLLLKHELKETAQLVILLFNKLQQLSEKHKDDLLPGYTHFQLAMPSSFGLWFGAYAESLVDDMELVVAAYKVADKNPLGSGAGYGSSFPLNRQLTTHLLRFGTMNYNSIYAQMTRGKAEKVALIAFAGIASTLSRMAYDICLYMNQQFAYLSFPDSLTTGSSIMPHKKNPDVFELLRAKCNRLQSLPNEMTILCNNLPSGYHRDMQLTKDILFSAIDSIKECLTMFDYALTDVQIRKDILGDTKFNDLFTVEEINKLVIGGMAFREAYKEVGKTLGDGTYNPSKKIGHTHQGSVTNLCNDAIKEQMKLVSSTITGLVL